MAESGIRFALIDQQRPNADAEQIDREEATSKARHQTAQRGTTVNQSPPTKFTRQTVGKRRDPDYQRLAVYVKKATRKAAARKWEDEGHRDQSVLVENLLAKYIGS